MTLLYNHDEMIKCVHCLKKEGCNEECSNKELKFYLHEFTKQQLDEMRAPLEVKLTKEELLRVCPNNHPIPKGFEIDTANVVKREFFDDFWQTNHIEIVTTYTLKKVNQNDC